MKRILPLVVLWVICLTGHTVMAQAVTSLPLVTTAKKIDVEPDEQEIRKEERHLRFCVKKSWDIKFGAGIWIITSDDKKVLSVVTLLDDPKEVPAAIAEMDKLVGVKKTEFAPPKAGVHRGIANEVLTGRGILVNSKKEVSVSVLTMFVYDAPVLVTTLVHADAVKEKAPEVKRFFESFALLVSPEEARAMENKSKRVDPASLQ